MQPVSVVIPVYNRCDLLRKALLSLACQSRPPGEIIVSDDGSDEDVPSAVRGMIPLFDCPVLYVRQSRDGFRAARCRNNGASAAHLGVLLFHDQDIVATGDYMAAIARAVRPGVFVTGYPIRLTERQTASLSEDMILRRDLDGLVTAAQRRKIVRQFVKDLFYYHARKTRLTHAARPKLRSGVFGVWRADLLRVDGFDANYVGWGNEDDDLGRRLYASGVCGRNVCLHHAPLHLHHPPNHRGGARENLPYARGRMAAIREGEVRAGRGLGSSVAEGHREAVRLN